ncbi:MAG: transcriptional regulator [Gammaproteobacteria bacterium]|nr:transcriptional regulator [Gammaproteobacteria bacterium]
MSNLHTRCLLTIVCEALLEPRIEADLKRLGAPGWTATPVRGRGEHGDREGHWENDGNVRLEVVCSSERAERIAAHLHEHYYRDYAIVSWLAEVKVLRPEKF